MQLYRMKTNQILKRANEVRSLCDFFYNYRLYKLIYLYNNYITYVKLEPSSTVICFVFTSGQWLITRKSF